MYIKLLRVACIVTLFTGAMAALASHPFTAEPWRLFFDLLQWPIDEQPSAFSDIAQQLNAVLGGVMVGWGATLLALTFGPLQSNPRPIARAMLMGLFAWFCVDSTGSFIAGLSVNVVLNAAFLSLFLVPLIGLMRR